MNEPNPILKHFSYSHLPPHLQAISQPICELAIKLDAILPHCAELELPPLQEGHTA